MKKQYVGVTGFTNKKQIENMTEVLDGHLGMYGVLMRNKTFSGHDAYTRWASQADIFELMKSMPNESLRTIHWCAENMVLEDIYKAVNLCNGYCNAIQLNMFYPAIDKLEELKEEYPSMQVIFQIQKDMFEDPKIMKNKIEPYSSLVDYVIIDQSMGEGIEINPAVSRAVAKEITKLDLGVVFAGGLNAEKVKNIGNLIRDFNASVDAEGQLMNLEKSLDDLKVKSYVSSAINEMYGGV